ncbi:PAS domain-containing protein [Dysgonomonas sp. 521]|uniref:sensor histidine kinase n=1 Tax=Dysgonomonas sp. 521 TaxID=2302932 RepID=UPI0013D0265D|nr:ATP-binding protein [Dysgonomonas sp. 521]NDV94940.1 PAS domain-containing protein [Dysgonomonas sp. 521]
MKSKILFWILAIIVFGSLVFIGLMFFRSDMYKFLLIEGISIIAIIFFILLYYRLIKPYQIISDGMELLKEQDFSTRLRPIANSEANKLIEIFNRMMDQLKDERLQVREKNHFLDLLIQASPQGVIILDFDDKITEINPSCLRLLNIKSIDDVKGKRLGESGINIGEQLGRLGKDDDVVIRSSGITMFRCIRSSFIDRGFAHPFILIEELTHELLKIEKKSYENIIRMMAHEVNNSVGAVSSTLNVISDILRQNEKNELIDVLPAVDASFDRCKHLGHFISNFAEVVKIPEPSLSGVSINELARSVESLTRIECQRRNINLNLNLTTGKDIVHIDSIQFEQVLVNIVKNAYEAINSDGSINITTTSSPLSVTIENNGPVIPEEVKQKLFTPFFTTKPTGQGIGLMFVREVLINHHCKFDLNSNDGWTKFEIEF